MSKLPKVKPYQFRRGERVVIIGAYEKDSKPIGVIGTIMLPNTKRRRAVTTLTNDGNSWCLCDPFDVPKGKRGDQYCRPLTIEEVETLDNVLDPFKLTEPVVWLVREL